MYVRIAANQNGNGNSANGDTKKAEDTIRVADTVAKPAAPAAAVSAAAEPESTLGNAAEAKKSPEPVASTTQANGQGATNGVPAPTSPDTTTTTTAAAAVPPTAAAVSPAT